MPKIKATFHAVSPLVGFKIPPKIPLIPAILPLKTNKIATATPMNPPPIAAESGVKFAQSILILFLLHGAIKLI